MRAAIGALVWLAFGGHAAADQVQELSAYVKALQENQLPDLAVDYLRQMEVRPDASPALKERLNFQIADALMDLAESADPETETKAHDEATERFKKTLAGRPDRATALESRNQLAYVLLKRGQRAAGLAEAATDPVKQKQFRATARAQFETARKEFAETVAECRKAAADAKPGERVKDGLVQARMNQAMVEYQSARAYEPGDKARITALEQAEKLFGSLASDTGKEATTFASIYAKLFESKSLLDAGKHRDAIDLMEEVLVNEKLLTGKVAPAFRALMTRSRLALYQGFNAAGQPERIVVEQAYAVRAWLDANKAVARAGDGLGIQLEAAKAYLKVAGKKPEDDKERARMLGLASQHVTTVARSSSLYAREAFRLREANAALLKGAGAAPATFEEALEAAAVLRDNGKYEDAAAAFEQALAMAPAKADAEKLADVQFGIVFSRFRSGNHAEVIAVAEKLFADRPTAKKAPLAADLALTSYYQTYRAAPPAARPAAAAKALAFAGVIEARYPNLAVADGARRLRGYLLMGTQKFAEAAAAFGAVTPEFPGYGEAQLRFSQCRMRDFDAAARSKTPAAAKPIAEEIVAALRRSAVAQRAELAKPGPDGKKPDPKTVELPALAVEADVTQAELLLRTNRPKEASPLVDPLVPLVTAGRKDLDPYVGRVLVAALDAASAQQDFAKADALVEKLVKTPSETPGKVTTVLVRLGQGLEKTWQGHVAAGRTAEAEAAHALIKRYLERFAERPQQDYRGARHVAEGFAAIGLFAAAAPAYEQALAELAKGPAEVAAASRPAETAFMRLKQAEAYRKAGQPEKAKPVLDALIEEAHAAKRGFPLRQKLELARTLQLWAESDPSKVAAAANEWNLIHNALGARRGAKTEDYFEARLGIGWCFWKQGKPGDGAKFLKATMAINPGVGSPAMLQRYEHLLKQIGP